MSEESGSIGDFFVKLFFKVDEGSEHEAHGALHGLTEKFHEMAKEAFAFNEIREAVEHIIEPIKEMWEGVEKVAETGHHLETFSQTMGIAVEDLQRFGFYAQSVGVSAETMQHSMLLLSRQMGEAASGGSKEVAEAFHKLGVEVRGADGAVRNVGQVMPELLEKFSALHTPAERASLAMKVFGRGGIELLPLLSAQSEKLQELNGDFQALGGSFSEELLERSHEFVEATNKSTFALGNMKRELSAGIMPTLTSFINIWLDFARTSWPEIAGVMHGIGETLGDVFMKTAGTAFDTFLRLIKDLFAHKDQLAAYVPVIKAVAAAFAILFAVFNPGKALIAGVMLAVEDFIGFIEGKDSVFGRLAVSVKDWWTELKTAHKWLGAIDDFLHNIGLGVKVVTGVAGAMAGGAGFTEAVDLVDREISKDEYGDNGKGGYVRGGNKDWLDKGIDRQRAINVDRATAAAPQVTHHNNMTFHVQARDPREAAHEIRKIVKEHHDTTTSEAMRDLATEGP
jgi:hypothetical protein